MLYTGGTTGMPKGVMYDIGGLTRGFVTLGLPMLGLAAPSDASEVAGMIAGASANGPTLISIPSAPLMHGTGCWLGWFIPHLAGGQVVTLQSRSLDPHELLSTIEAHRATSITIVGDSFAKPIIRALDEGKSGGVRYDTSSIGMFISSGVMWTTEVKQELLQRIEQAVLVDAIGSSEGSMGTQITMKGVPTETAKFTRQPETKVFTDDDREVEPGSDEVGMVAAGGNVPIGYYKDEEKSARTFRVIDGVRYSFPGDFAKVGADGSLILLGRGSQVINTGGEKVFPEEVEEAVKRVAGVSDCLVVGIDDEKFGQAVTAVVSLEDGATVDPSAIIASVKTDLAGYKAPKSIVVVDQVPRAPNGKADYRTAKAHAEAAT
jgi:fatty-acyl-CoA synthase